MKTTLMIGIYLVLFSQCFSQNKAFQDTINSESISKHKVLIRCGSTIKNSDTPLFIIDGLPVGQNEKLFTELDPKDILSIEVLKAPVAFGCYGRLGKNGAILIKTKTATEPIDSCKEYPFKTYRILNDHWVVMNDVYNSIRSMVPNVMIQTGPDVSSIPNIRMRGDDNTIVIVDGVRYDASILNMINPNDIESIVVAPDVSATNYLINH